MIENRFPALRETEEDNNPAIQLFGRRFFSDQTDIEYLVELLLVFISSKKIGENVGWKNSFLDMETIEYLSNSNLSLKYNPPAHIILKLFSFLGFSKLETRHTCHKIHFEKVNNLLENSIETFSNIDKKHIIEIIEQIFLGFVGVAKDRTWCTQTFLPISTALIAVETRWREIQAKKLPDLDWDEAFQKAFFTFSTHLFMARGGELLFLQLCNVFRNYRNQELSKFVKRLGYDVNVSDLKKRLEQGLIDLVTSVPSLEKLAKWIENSDPDTAQKTDKYTATCGWCPSETWPEAYLFAYEMVNLCESAIDPIEKIELLKLCCVFQVLRSLCAQSVRYWKNLTEEEKGTGGANGFAWIVTDYEGKNKPLKDAGKTNFQKIQQLIHGALRNPIIKPSSKGYKIADEQGQALFIKLGKQIGFIVPPKTGPGARFVITESLLRYLVMALIPPGERRTLESFKETLYKHFGIAIGGQQLDKAVRWTYPKQSFVIRKKDENWFEEKLRATGFLIPLSDAVSLVTNPFSKSKH
jgi:hypothetical protein